MAKVIDTHAHLGECCVFGLLSTEEEMMRRMDECKIDATIVQPYPGAKNACQTHDRIAEMCAKRGVRPSARAGYFRQGRLLRCGNVAPD